MPFKEPVQIIFANSFARTDFEAWQMARTDQPIDHGDTDLQPFSRFFDG